MKKNNNIHGSKWRKWDLHIHSPLSGLNNQFLKLDDGTPDWEKYISRLEEIKDISVIGITDYFTIEGYKEVLKYKKKGRLENYDLILPNIEFRLDNFLSSKKDGGKPRRLTLHVIFSDTIPPEEIEDQFLYEINFCYEGEPFSKDEVRKLKRSSLEELGRKLKSEQKSFQKKSDFEVGCMTAVVRHSDISDILESKRKIFKNKYMVILAEEYLSLIDWDSQDHNIRKVLLQKSAAIFSGNPKTRDWALGKRDLSPEEFCNEFKSLKPCIFGSDAHSLEKIGKPDNDKYTWIKADPTFEGFRQIHFEPELRVMISDKNELYLYPHISSIHLLNAKKFKNKKDIIDFPPINLCEPIYLNPNLNSIIGARASGKTVLVELISFVFNKQQKTQSPDGKLPLVQYLSERFPCLSVELDYKQGEEIKKIKRNINEFSDPLYVPPLTIEYWSQGQIEKIADNKEKIDNYLTEQITSGLQSELSNDIKNLTTKLQEFRNNYISKFEINIEYKKLKARKKEIEKYFEKLKTDEYRKIVKKIKDNRSKIQLIDNFVNNLEAVSDLFDEIESQINMIDFPKENELLSIFQVDSTLSEKIKEILIFLNSFPLKNKKIVLNLISKIKSSRIFESLLHNKKTFKNEFLKYCEKVGVKISKQEYERQTEILNSVNNRMRELDFKLKEFDKSKEKHKLLTNNLYKKLSKWKAENNKIIEEFNKLYSKSNITIIWDDPYINISDWVIKQFLDSDQETKYLIEKYFHISSPVREDYISDIVKELIEDKKETIDKIILYLKNNKLPKLKKSKGKEENLKWFFVRKETNVLRENLMMRLMEFSNTGINLIKYKDKILGKDSTSFGERCGTIIELILHSGDHPIIIDQPEEHLDAKFIADRVVEIIRTQKHNRQIIICSHNANIVVLSDSELITILSVDSDGTNCNQGTLENPIIRKQIYNVLEGGSEAFIKREKKYGFGD